MSLIIIILIGLTLTVLGSALNVAAAPIFGISYKKVLKRTLWFIVGFEAFVAIMFCVFNGYRPTFGGQIIWHIARIVQLSLMGVINNKLYNLTSDKKEGGKRFPIAHVVIMAFITQLLQYQIIMLIY